MDTEQMDIREYVKKKNFDELSPEQKTFVAKRIMMEVQRIAGALGISEETAFDFYMKGAFDGHDF